MGSFHVFPGGRVDTSDRDLSLPYSGRKVDPLPALLSEPQSPVDAVFGLFVAAIRETLEEAGIFLGEARTPAQIDRAIREGLGFREALVKADARLRLDRLVPYARWVTPPMENRRFDTRFFSRAAIATRASAPVTTVWRPSMARGTGLRKHSIWPIDSR